MDHGTTAAPERPAALVRASGGIVVGHAADGAVRVAIVHRPHRFDWTFPKGKLEPDESFEDCARREVYEETGLRCRLGRFVGHTEYIDRKDRPKVVAYWLMHVEGGEFSPNGEVDELRWLPPLDAVEQLTYERDRELMASLADALARETTAA